MRIISLTQEQVALIDDEDFDYISAFKWCAHWEPNSKRYYAVTSFRAIRTGKHTIVRMHQVILGFPLSLIDHKNGNSLDNRRCNLRLATRSQNGQNSGLRKNNRSGFKGVSFHSQNGRWTARISASGKYRHLGCFDTKEEAHEAYKHAAIELHGEFARY